MGPVDASEAGRNVDALEGRLFFLSEQSQIVNAAAWSTLNVRDCCVGLSACSGAMCLFRLVVCGEAWLAYGLESERMESNKVDQ